MVRLSYEIKLLALFIAGASAALAQPLSVTTTVNQTSIAVNQQLVFTVELTGEGAQKVGQPELPDMGGYLTFLGSGGSSQNITVVNGKMSVSKSFTFYYLAAKPGSMTIPPVTVVYKNKTAASQPISLTITASAAPSPSTQGKSNNAQASSGNKLYLRTIVNKKSVYPNEAVIVTYRIYAAVTISGYSIAKLTETTGFWVEDVEMPQQPQTSEQVLNGQRYVTADIKKMTVFPTSLGKRRIGPLSLQCEVKQQSRRSRDPFGSFFDDSFFGRTVRQTIASPIVEINVKPFPQENKPASFNGAVGQFKLNASIDKTDVNTDEAVTLKVTLSGVGNIQLLPKPKVHIPADFEQYEPTVSQKIDRTNGVISGAKTFEYVLVPRFPGEQRIKPVTFSYFDAKAGSYKTLQTKEIVINVAKGKGQIVRGGGSGLSKEEVKYVGQDIRFIKVQSEDYQPIGYRLYKSFVFYLLLIAPLVILGVALVYQKHLQKLSGNVAYARSRKANAVAMKRLSKAKQLLNEDSQKEFFAEVSNALAGFAADKLNKAKAGLISNELENEFKKRRLDQELTKEYFDLIRFCDLQRFAPSSVKKEEMQDSYQAAKKVIINLEKAL
ncbi:hypothetical protein DRI50_05310 [candidate division KSB1 bacterium]|nr:MAG: hypothetical protein DRI50_05310 [candidate division KSB1 bacterium]